MRKFLYYSLLCLLWISVDGCNDEEASAPPKPSFSVDKTSGLSGSTEFTFTVNQVDANNISLLPYGVENRSFGGISIAKSSFTNGVATVKFKYTKVGVFNAVVVSNNNSTDGTSIKNVTSDARAITISSNKTVFTEFSVGFISKIDFGETEFTSLTTDSKIDTIAKTINVTVRYSFPKDKNNADYFTTPNIGKLVARFTSSAFSTVSIGSVQQSSGVTEVNFSSPVNYVVKAQDGTTSTYRVTVTVTPAQTTKTIKAVTGAVGTRSLPGFVDNTNKFVVIYDILGTASDKFKEVGINYQLDGNFATFKLNGNKFATAKVADLSSSKSFVVTAQDSTSTTYNFYAVAAPKLTLNFNSLNPVVTSSSNSDFNINLRVLAGTPIASIATSSVIDLPVGVTVTGVTIEEESKRVAATATTAEIPPPVIAFTSGNAVDFTKQVKFTVTVNDTNIGKTYKVIYLATVTAL